MSRKFLLDSSVIIGNFRQNPKAKKLISKAKGEFCCSSIVLAELYEGLERAVNRQKVNAQIQEILATTKIYDFSLKEAELFGKIKAILESEGQVISDMDMLIAATSLVNNLILITLNVKHFEKIAGLKILSTV